VTDAVIKIVLAYLLGSVSGSLLLGQLRRVDIRTMGSGNAGGTNALRTQGIGFALGVVIIDVGKGWLAAGWLAALEMPGIAPLFTDYRAGLACGFAAVLGHCYPVFYGFRGGKGVATLLGVLIAVAIWCLPLFILTFLAAVVLTGFVGLGSILATLSLLPSMALLGPDPVANGYWVFAVAMAAFVVFTHRSNLLNMKHGEEQRFNQVMLRNWFK